METLQEKKLLEYHKNVSNAPVERLSTGPNHINILNVIEHIVSCLNKLGGPYYGNSNANTDVDYFIKIINRLEQLSNNLDALRKTTLNKKISQQKILIILSKIDECIPKYNKKLTFLRGRLAKFDVNKDYIGFEIFPFINTKKRHSKGKKHDLLNQGIITYPENVIDKDNESIVLCKTRNKMCLVIDKDDLYNWLITELENQKKFKLISNMIENDKWLTQVFNDKNINHVIKLIAIDCPICKNKDIKVSKCWPYIQKEKKYSIMKKVWDLFGQIMINQFESKMVFCKNNACRYANHGILIPKIYEAKSVTSIFCKICNLNHEVHVHKIKCPAKGCQITFCSVCQMSPYHHDEVCQGPLDDIDPLILKTTRPCPECGIRSEKSDGCDRMKCANCKSNWCWRCLQKLDKDDPYKHICLPEGVVNGLPDGVYRDYGVPLEMYQI